MQVMKVDGAVIFSMPKENLHQIKHLLNQLKLSGYNEEQRKRFMDGPKEKEVFSIISDDNESIIIIVGKEKAKLAILKTGPFSKLKSKVIKSIKN